MCCILFNSFKFFLDEIKIDPDAILDDKYNDTPLSVTSYYSGGYSLEMAKILVERGANVNHITGGEDRTPLLTAIWKNFILKLQHNDIFKKALF